MVKSTWLPDFSTISHKWNLPASSGREQLGGTFVNQGCDSIGSSVILAEVFISGRFWPDPPFEDKTESFEQPVAYFVALPQVVFQKKQLEFLIAELMEWIRVPHEIIVELSKIHEVYQSFVLSFGVKEGIICSIEKPVCTIIYTSGTFNGEWSFVVDQSCIRIFLEGLNSALGLLSAG